MQALRYIVTLTIAPAFFAAAIYLCLGRIIVVYGEHVSRFRPRTYTLTFIACDVLSLVFQAAGGALASAANTQKDLQTGVDVMLAGLGLQVASMTLFIILSAEFAWRVHQSKHDLNPTHVALRESKLFKFFLFGTCQLTGPCTAGVSADLMNLQGLASQRSQSSSVASTVSQSCLEASKESLPTMRRPHI
jgi:hypothetical protein